jgi:hypothetical protein
MYFAKQAKCLVCTLHDHFKCCWVLKILRCEWSWFEITFGCNWLSLFRAWELGQYMHPLGGEAEAGAGGLRAFFGKAVLCHCIYNFRTLQSYMAFAEGISAVKWR